MPMEVYCIICQPPESVLMDLDKTFPRKKGKHGIYRVRRYKCLICGYEQTIHADGWRDLETEPDRAMDEAKKQYNQEEKNEDKLRVSDSIEQALKLLLLSSVFHIFQGLIHHLLCQGHRLFHQLLLL